MNKKREQMLTHEKEEKKNENEIETPKNRSPQYLLPTNDLPSTMIWSYLVYAIHWFHSIRNCFLGHCLLFECIRQLREILKWASSEEQPKYTWTDRHSLRMNINVHISNETYAYLLSSKMDNGGNWIAFAKSNSNTSEI